MTGFTRRLLGGALLYGMTGAAQAQVFGSNNNSFRVLKAEYGSGQNWTDVTDRVQRLVRGNGVEFRVDGETLTDPMPGVKKTLRVRYVFRNRTRTENFEDLAMVRLGNPDAGGGGFTGVPVNGTLRITKAEYGEGSRWRDVTDLVSRQVSRDGVRMAVNNESMGGDPAPSVAKSLRVEYDYQRNRRTITVPEMSTLVLPEGSGGGTLPTSGSRATLEILEADYGARGRRNNVTDVIRRAVIEDRVNLAVNNATMDGDPYPGPKKELHIRYRYQGREFENFSQEGSTLVLPNRYDRPAGGNRRSNPQ